MHGNFKHGCANDNNRLYRIWHNMKQRCYNPKHVRFECYGMKGVKICDEWKNNFIAFKNWAYDNGYDDTLTIDRIDSDGDYCPENCRWITLAENNKYSNMKKNVIYQATSPEGDCYLLDEYQDFCKQHNLNKGCVCSVMNGKLKSTKGWFFERIILN